MPFFIAFQHTKIATCVPISQPTAVSHNTSGKEENQNLKFVAHNAQCLSTKRNSSWDYINKQKGRENMSTYDHVSLASVLGSNRIFT